MAPWPVVRHTINFARQEHEQSARWSSAAAAAVSSLCVGYVYSNPLVSEEVSNKTWRDIERGVRGLRTDEVGLAVLLLLMLDRGG